MIRKRQIHKVVGSQYIVENCLVCGIDNPLSLGAQFLNLDDGQVVVRLLPNANLQSYPDRLHGGVISTVLDELLGRTIQAQHPKQLSVTIDLEVKFRNPVPIDKEICGIAWLEKNRSRVFDARGQIVLADGTVAAEAFGRFAKIDESDLGNKDLGNKDLADSPSQKHFFEDTRLYPETILI